MLINCNNYGDFALDDLGLFVVFFFFLIINFILFIIFFYVDLYVLLGFFCVFFPIKFLG